MADDYDHAISPKNSGHYYNPPVDHSAVSDDFMVVTAGQDITLMALCQLSADGKWDPTDADAEATANGLLGIALSDPAADGDEFYVVLKGVVRDDTWNFTVGADLFVSTTSGGITETAPAGSNDVVRRVGHAMTADIIMFNPDNHYEVVP